MTKAVDKHGLDLEVGHQVHCYIPGHGSPASYGFVIGVMDYAEHDEIVCLATEHDVGMPVNTGHLTRTSSDLHNVAREFRERYLTRWPGALKDEPVAPEPLLGASPIVLERFDHREV